MGGLRQRLAWHDGGAVADGPRRYLLMRPDVLMGALARLDGTQRQAFLDAWAASASAHGSDSLRAYAQAVGHDAPALLAATAEAAADLGWGAWTFERRAGALHLRVADSPFVSGWRAASATGAGGSAAASDPVCAPVRGMLQAVAQLVLSGEIEVRETSCAAMIALGAHEAHGAPDVLDAHAACTFTARVR